MTTSTPTSATTYKPRRRKSSADAQAPFVETIVAQAMRSGRPLDEEGFLSVMRGVAKRLIETALSASLRLPLRSNKKRKNGTLAAGRSRIFSTSGPCVSGGFCGQAFATPLKPGMPDSPPSSPSSPKGAPLAGRSLPRLSRTQSPVLLGGLRRMADV